MFVTRAEQKQREIGSLLASYPLLQLLNKVVYPGDSDLKS